MSMLEEEEKKAEVDDVFQYPKTGIGPVLAAIEGCTRCAICRVIPEPALSLPCCEQVYCSLCIRSTLDRPSPRCPQCRISAAQNELKLSKLQPVFSIWKRHRNSILAFAIASAKAGEVEVAPLVAEEPSNGTRGTAQGKGAGRIVKGLFFHSMKEAKLRELLRKVGLSSDGSKDAMIARYKRLVLLDTCSNDRQVPLPRSELIKQVKRWEREKAVQEKAAAEERKRKEATPGAAGSEGQEEGQPAAHRLPPQSQESKDHFKALLKNHKRGRGGAGGGAAGADNGKKRRVWRDPEDEDDSTVSNGAVASDAVASGAVGNGAVSGAVASDAVVGSGTVGSGAVDSGAVASGTVGTDAAATGTVGSECVVTPTPERPLRVVDSKGEGARAAEVAAAVPGGSEGLERSSPVLGSSQLKSEGGDAAEMQILGVAGKMVRTRGPWRCAFSTGALASGARRNEAGGVCIAKEEPPAPGTSADDPGASGPTSALGGRDGRLLLPPSSSSLSPLPSPPSGAAREGPSTAISGPVAASGATSGGGTLSVGCGGTAAVGDAQRSDDGDGRPSSRGVGAPALEEAGIVYLNAVTGETVREPPAELVAQAEEAEKGGDYLVFIPCRSFVAAVRASSAAAATTSTPSIPRISGAAVGSGAEPLLPTAGRSNTAGSRDDVRKPAEGGGREAGGKQDGSTLNQFFTSSPLVADAPAAPGGSGGGSVGTWERLSVVSALGTTTSHPRVPRPMIDLSQGAPAPPPLLVGHDGDGISAGGGGGSGKDGVEIVGGGAGAEPAEDIWTCPACTLNNGVRYSVCEICKTARPKTFRSQRLAQSSSYSSAASGSGSRRPPSRLRLPPQRAKGVRAPQSAITAFTARPGSAVKNDSSSNSSTRGRGDEGGDGDCET